MAITVLGPGGYPKSPYLPGGNRSGGPFSVLGAGGYPRPPYADFSGKSASGGRVFTQVFSVLSPGGYPKPPYVTALFATKSPSGAAAAVHDHPFLATVGRLMGIP